MARSRSRPEEADLSDSALDALIGDTATPEELGALFRRLQKRLAERILAGELTEHLGYAVGEAKPPTSTAPATRNAAMVSAFLR